MRFKINVNGNLRIERAGQMKVQECPYDMASLSATKGENAECGDWCPLFGEPEYTNDSKGATLRICHTELCGRFIDEREELVKCDSTPK